MEQGVAEKVEDEGGSENQKWIGKVKGERETDECVRKGQHMAHCKLLDRLAPGCNSF